MLWWLPSLHCRGAFFLAKTLVMIPMEVVQVTVFATVTYFMFGFQATAAKFLTYTATLIIFTLCSETLGYMAAIATPDSKVGVAVLSIVLLLLISFSGYLVSRRACGALCWSWLVHDVVWRVAALLPQIASQAHSALCRRSTSRRPSPAGVLPARLHDD